MNIIYRFKLPVYRTTMESGYSGGNYELIKDFESLADLEIWTEKYYESDPEVKEWIDKYNFPQILKVEEPILQKITIKTL